MGCGESWVVVEEEEEEEGMEVKVLTSVMPSSTTTELSIGSVWR